MHEAGHEILQPGALQFKRGAGKVISQYSRHGDGNADSSGDKRIADGAGFDIETCRTACSNIMCLLSVNHANPCRASRACGPLKVLAGKALASANEADSQCVVEKPVPIAVFPKLPGFKNNKRPGHYRKSQ